MSEQTKKALYKWQLPLTRPDEESEIETVTVSFADANGKNIREQRRLTHIEMQLTSQQERIGTNMSRLSDEIKRLPVSLAHERNLSSDDKDYEKLLREPPSKLESLQKLLNEQFEELEKVNIKVEENADDLLLTCIKIVNRSKKTQDVQLSDIDLDAIGKDMKTEILDFFSKRSNGTLPKPSDSN